MKNYKRLIAAAVTVLAAASVFAGCKKQQEEPAPVSEETTAVTTQEEPEEIRSATTGQIVEKPNFPILVAMPNDSAARPHYGISRADIVYEMHVEGNITRFLAVFADDLPDRVEPVRSARVYFIDVVQDWMGALVHYGGDKSRQAWSPYYKLRTVNVKYREDGEAGSKYMKRDSSRSAPNNVILDVKAYAETLSGEQAARFPFKFSEEPTAGSVDVNNIAINYSGSNRVSYEYNADTKTYDRFINGKKFTDANDGSQVSVENVVIQEVEKTKFDSSNNGHINLNMFGSGKAYFHIGGKMVEGSWERAGLDVSTVYRDADGNEMKLAVGQSFVQVVSNDVEVTNS